jgi:hypothetical protein
VPYGPHRAVIERVVDGDFLAGRLPEGSEYWLMTEQDGRLPPCYKGLLKQPKSEEVRHA